MTLEELFAVAEIVEKLTNRYRDQEAAHKAALTEFRTSFTARTGADEKIIEGLRAEIIRVNEAHGRTKVENDGLRDELTAQRDAFTAEVERIRRELCEGRDALRAEVAALQERLRRITLVDDDGSEPCDPPQTERAHPVAVGGYLRRLTGFNSTPAGEVARVTLVDADDPSQVEYEVVRPNGQKGRWSAKGCEPCDPPTEATHDTPEGRSVAESVIRDGRKTEPKPGDTVRLVRIPSRDVVSLELQTVLEWPWIERWGTLNQIAMVVEPRYQLDGAVAVAVCLRTNVHARWPINCLEVVAEATHDTEAGKAAAESAVSETVTDEIKVGDLVEVVSNTGRNTWLADVGSVGTVTSIETLEDSLSVRLKAVPDKKNVCGGYVSLCDVRKVPQ